MNRTTYKQIKQATEILEQIQRRTNPIELTDAEREAVNIVSRAISYSLNHIRPEEDDDTAPLIFSDIEGMQALSEDIERLNVLELSEETRAEYLAVITRMYGVA